MKADAIHPHGADLLFVPVNDDPLASARGDNQELRIVPGALVDPSSRDGPILVQPDICEHEGVCVPAVFEVGHK